MSNQVYYNSNERYLPSNRMFYEISVGASDQILAADTEETVLYDITGVFNNPGDHLSLSSGVFTVKTPGIYSISYVVQFEPEPLATTEDRDVATYILVTKPGFTEEFAKMSQRYEDNATGVNHITHSGSVTISLNVGDTFETRIKNNGLFLESVKVSKSYTSLTVQKLY